jgi:hypothetical protein
MFRDASKFNSLGIAARGSLFSSYSKGQPMTAQTEFTNQQKEEFLKESEQSLASDDSMLDLK